MITIKIKQGLVNLQEAATIRNAVFVDEQGFIDEYDEIDDTAFHAVLYYNGEPAATARLYPECGSSYHIGRVAVLKAFRGKSLGTEIMNAAEEYARSLGGTEVYISAQTRAYEFYRKLGYTKYGEEYLEQHCPHIAMKKILIK